MSVSVIGGPVQSTDEPRKDRQYTTTARIIKTGEYPALLIQLFNISTTNNHAARFTQHDYELFKCLIIELTKLDICLFTQREPS